MNLTRCPICLSDIDDKFVNKCRKESKGWITKLKCPSCGVELKQTWVSMVYAWFVFGFMGYAGLFFEGVWYLAPIPFFLVLLALMLSGKCFEIDHEKKT